MSKRKRIKARQRGSEPVEEGNNQIKKEGDRERGYELEKPDSDHWSCITHLSAEGILKSVVIEEKKFKNIESECFGPRSVNDLDLWYS